ncbi:hypothetical protein BJ508DRAFT_132986 [Ascobolus immersus RN42]|uniref:Uncharacterized protein n=1 Tax=Ascobolus immersus RN42 TaxID=1160509 RepID=A0A3N4I742_ASCIM|nr:hypothetical protein BJ508DRAFT_132986 [Ascobolus immersus RN42]
MVSKLERRLQFSEYVSYFRDMAAAQRRMEAAKISESQAQRYNDCNATSTTATATEVERKPATAEGTKHDTTTASSAIVSTGQRASDTAKHQTVAINSAVEPTKHYTTSTSSGIESTQHDATDCTTTAIEISHTCEVQTANTHSHRRATKRPLSKIFSGTNATPIGTRKRKQPLKEMQNTIELGSPTRRNDQCSELPHQEGVRQNLKSNHYDYVEDVGDPQEPDGGIHQSNHKRARLSVKRPLVTYDDLDSGNRSSPPAWHSNTHPDGYSPYSKRQRMIYPERPSPEAPVERVYQSPPQNHHRSLSPNAQANVSEVDPYGDSPEYRRLQQQYELEYRRQQMKLQEDSPEYHRQQEEYRRQQMKLQEDSPEYRRQKIEYRRQQMKLEEDSPEYLRQQREESLEYRRQQMKLQQDSPEYRRQQREESLEYRRQQMKLQEDSPEYLRQQREESLEYRRQQMNLLEDSPKVAHQYSEYQTPPRHYHQSASPKVQANIAELDYYSDSQSPLRDYRQGPPNLQTNNAEPDPYGASPHSRSRQINYLEDRAASADHYSVYQSAPQDHREVLQPHIVEPARYKTSTHSRQHPMNYLEDNSVSSRHHQINYLQDRSSVDPHYPERQYTHPQSITQPAYQPDPYYQVPDNLSPYSKRRSISRQESLPQEAPQYRTTSAQIPPPTARNGGYSRTASLSPASYIYRKAFGFLSPERGEQSQHPVSPPREENSWQSMPSTARKESTATRSHHQETLPPQHSSIPPPRRKASRRSRKGRPPRSNPKPTNNGSLFDRFSMPRRPSLVPIPVEQSAELEETKCRVDKSGYVLGQLNEEYRTEDGKPRWISVKALERRWLRDLGYDTR